MYEFKYNNIIMNKLIIKYSALQITKSPIAYCLLPTAYCCLLTHSNKHS